MIVLFFARKRAAVSAERKDKAKDITRNQQNGEQKAQRLKRPRIACPVGCDNGEGTRSAMAAMNSWLA